MSGVGRIECTVVATCAQHCMQILFALLCCSEKVRQVDEASCVCDLTRVIELNALDCVCVVSGDCFGSLCGLCACDVPSSEVCRGRTLGHCTEKVEINTFLNFV